MALRHLFLRLIVTAALGAAILWATTAYVTQGLTYDAIHDRYLEGSISREEARDKLGDIVDEWPTHPQELTSE